MTESLTIRARLSLRHAILGWLLLLILVLGGYFNASAASAADNKLIATTSVGAPLYFENGSGFFNLLTAELFKRLKIDYELQFLPAQRSLVFTNDGTTDVIIGRTAAIEKKLPNIVRVPVNILDFDFTAYSKDPAIRINGWESLSPYTVGIINGWRIVEQNVVGAKQVVKVNDFAQLLALLDKGRIDVAILDRVMGEWTFRQLGLDLKINDPPLISKPNFIYLHKKHEKLVPDFTDALLEMKRDGTYRLFYETATRSW